MLWFALLVGCKVLDAPEDLEELVVFTFVHFDDSDRVIQDATENLLSEVTANAIELEDGYKVDQLTQADLLALDIDTEVIDIVGAIGVADYTHDLGPVTEYLTHERKDNVYDHIEEYSVDGDGRSCFLDQSCSSLDQTVREVVKVPILGKVTRNYEQNFRWVDTESGLVLLARTLSPDPFEMSTNVVQVFQQYSVIMVWSEDGHARRAEAVWADAEFVGLDVPESFAVDSTLNGISKQCDRIDEAIDAE
jgi:hypothetical protein